MFVSFTPFTYLLSVFYTFVLFALYQTSDFIPFWFLIEVFTFVFIGISLTSFSTGFSGLISLFFVQSVSSFVVLVSYLLSINWVFTVALLLNIGIFPFFSWYLSSLISFPNFPLFLSLTFQKLPILLIIMFFNVLVVIDLFILSTLLSIFISSALILSSNDMRSLVLASSIGNSGWFILSSLSGDLVLFFFFLFYSSFLFILFSFLNGFNSSSIGTFFVVVFMLLSLSGFPPFPIFFTNIYILLTLFSDFSFFVFLILFLNSLLASGYVVYLISGYVYRYSNTYFL